MAVAALVISIISILWNCYVQFVNGARLKVEARSRKVYDHGHYYRILWIEVKNRGRSSTEIDGVDFPQRRWFRTSLVSVTSVRGRLGGDGVLPCSMAPGAVEKFQIPIATLLSSAAMTEAKPSQMRIRVRTGHKNKIRRLPKEIVTELEKQLEEREAKAEQDD